MAESSRFLRPEILAKIARLGVRAKRVVEGSISGLHRSPLHGVSVEFADYREYAPGDDLKRLDWRAYARSNRFHIKRYEEESNLRATLLVDASRSMRYQGRSARQSKYDYSATLAASQADCRTARQADSGRASSCREDRQEVSAGDSFCRFVRQEESTARSACRCATGSPSSTAGSART